MATKKARPEAPIPCLVCGTRLPLAKNGRTAPKDGTLFRSYGSSESKFEVVLALSAFVEIIVCDVCLRTAAENGRVLRGQPPVYVNPPSRYTVATIDDDGQIVDGESPWPKVEPPPWRRDHGR